MGLIGMISGSAADRVLLTGAGGQLAGAINAEFAESAEILALNHAGLDIADAAGVLQVARSFRPTVIINCAAYNRVDEAETSPEPALTANAFGVRVLARAAADVDATFVHYSTDFVFDGKTTRPYTEDDPTNPASVYGASKLLGEWFALEAPRAFVLRVASLFGGTPAKSSVDRIVDALLEGREAKVFVDRTASPGYVIDIASATRALLKRGDPGLYHCVNSGSCTWYELAQEAARILGCEADARLTPMRAEEMPLPAARPLYAALSNVKLTAVASMPAWNDALARHINLRRSLPAGSPSRQSQDTR